MTKQGKTFLLVVAGFFLLVAVFFLWRRSKASDGEGEEAARTSVHYDIADPTVSEVDVNKPRIYAGLTSDNDKDNIENYWASLDRRDDSELEPGVSSAPGQTKGRNKTIGFFEEDELSALGLKGGSSSAAQVPSSRSSSYDEDYAARRAASRARDEEAERMFAEQRAELQRRSDAVAAGRNPFEPEAVPAAGPEPEAAPESEERLDFSSVSSGITSRGGDGVGFAFDGDSKEVTDSISFHTYKCVFSEDLKVSDGDRVYIRVLEDIPLGGVVIPRNTRLQGIATIGRRLFITVSSVEMRGRIYPLSFDGYDSDGAKGLYAPDLSNASTSGVADQAINRGINNIGSSNAGRVVSDVLQMGMLVSRSARGSVSVTVPAGYPFFLVKKTKLSRSMNSGF